MKTEKERMLEGKLYKSSDPELVKISRKSRQLLDDFNAASHTDFDARSSIIKDLFGSVGKNPTVNKPFYCDYGVNIHVGDNFYANFDCIILDVNKVTIGNNVMFAPRVAIYTATHPIDAVIRNEYYELGLPVKIGDNVWIGGSVVINPGVTIGDNTVIGSGSVVTKDIPANVVAAGNPCRVLRPITDEDKRYWTEMKKEYENT